MIRQSDLAKTLASFTCLMLDYLNEFLMKCLFVDLDDSNVGDRVEQEGRAGGGAGS